MYKFKNVALISLIIVFLLNGCVSRDYIMNKKGEVVKSTFINQNGNGALWLQDREYPKKGYGTIVFFRSPFMSDRVLEPEKLFANGKFVTDMKQFGFYPFHAKAGHYTFTLGDAAPEDVYYKDDQVISGELKDGDIFYVELGGKIKMSIFSRNARATFKKLSPYHIKFNVNRYPASEGFYPYSRTHNNLFRKDYRLSATNKRDIQGLVKLKKDTTVNSAFVIEKQTVLDGATGMLEGVKASVSNNGADMLSNGIEGAVVLAIPSMIKASATSEFKDDYLEYVGTKNGYDMDYIFE